MRVRPGDVVTFRVDDPNTTAQIVGDRRQVVRSKSVFQNDKDAERLAQVWRVRQVIMSRGAHLVVCASAHRAMLLTAGGVLVVSETRYLVDVNDVDDKQ